MDAVSSPVFTRKQAVLFFWVAGLLALLALAAWLVLPHNLIKLAVVGAMGSVVGLLVFAFPKYGAYLGTYYVYAGLSYYTGVPVAAVVTFLITAAVVLQLVRGDSTQVTDPFFNWSLALFTVFVVQSFLFAYNYDYAFRSFSLFAKSVLFVFVIGQLIRNERDLETLAFVVFAATLSTVILGVVNIEFGIVENSSVLVPGIGGSRFAATHGNANVAALYFVAGLPLGIYAVKRARSIMFKLLLIAGVIAIVVATIMTFSRQTIFPLTVVLLATLFKEARSKWVYSVVLLVVVIGLFLIPDYYWYRIFTISEIFEDVNEDWSLAIRVKAFQTAWHLFLQHPFTGVGLNNVIVRSASELFVRIGAHNGYLEVLAGVGLFGFVAFIMMPVAGIRGFVRAFRTRWPEEQRWMNDLSYYFLLSAVAVFIAVFFEPSHFYRVFWLPVVGGLIAGKLAGTTRRSTKKTET
jgi:O-antigen ligase